MSGITEFDKAHIGDAEYPDGPDWGDEERCFPL